MQFDYLVIIREYWQYRNTNNKNRKKIIKQLQKNKPNVFLIINDIHENYNDLNDDDAIKIVRKLKNGNDLDYLNCLLELFIKKTIIFENGNYSKINIEYQSMIIFILTILYLEIIDILKSLQINDDNKERIKIIIGKLALNKYFNYGFLVNDFNSSMIFNYLLWAFFREDVNDNETMNINFQNWKNLYMK